VRNGDAARLILQAYDQAPTGAPGEPIRKQSLAALRHLVGSATLGDDRARWGEWLSANYPTQAARLAAGAVNWPRWEKRLAGVDWNNANADRGRLLFSKCACATCHTGGRALGPDLRGAANRFSRKDLFTAICDPSRDVPPRYRTTLVGTTSGRVYQGLIIYEAADGMILQTGPEQTIRLASGEIAQKRQQRTSLMPAGLVDNLTDRDLADLYAYLKTLR
jgi:putative heme-binding domain-containing protein